MVRLRFLLILYVFLQHENKKVNMLGKRAGLAQRAHCFVRLAGEYEMSLDNLLCSHDLTQPSTAPVADMRSYRL